MLDYEGQEHLPTKRRRGFSALIESSTLVAAITAMLFTLGWIYLSEYYAASGVDIQSLDLPLYVPLEASLTPIVALQIASSAKAWILLVGIVAVTAFRFVWLLYHARVDLWMRSSSKLFGEKMSSLTRLLRIIFTRYIRLPKALRVEREELKNAINDHIITGSIKWLVRISQIVTLSLIPLFILYAAGRAGQRQAREEQVHPRFKVRIIFKSDAGARLTSDLIRLNSNGELRGLAQTKDLLVVFSKNAFPSGAATAFVFPMSNIVFVENEVLIRDIAGPNKDSMSRKKPLK